MSTEPEEIAENVTKDENRNTSSRLPPYTSYKTFQTLLEECKTSMPPQIDKSVLRRFAGGVQNQLIHALKALSLVDENRVPRPTLKALVAAYGTDDYKAQLRAVMATTYPYVFELDLMAATPTMFADKFKEATGATEEVLRKCRTFFLHAAKDVGVPLGPRLEQGTFPRAKSNGPKRPKAPKQASPGTPEAQPSKPDPVPAKNAGSVMDKLLSKFPNFDPKWPDDIKKQWFEGFERFMSGAGIDKKGGSES